MAARSALWTGITLVMSEPGIEMLDNVERAELMRKKQITLATQPLARYPRVVECAMPLTACDNPEDHYKFGVDLFIGGLAAIAADRARRNLGQLASSSRGICGFCGALSSRHRPNATERQACRARPGW
jgi:hypothetical protein